MVKGLKGFQKGFAANPKGNPNMNIKDAPKPGPTKEGIMTGAIKHMTKGASSKLLKDLRKCNQCPLGAKEKVIKVGEKEKKITVPAKCPYYKEGKRTCPIDKKLYIQYIKSYLLLEDAGWDEDDMAKILFHDAMSDAIKSGMVEEITKGHPAFYKDLHSKRALEAVKILSNSKARLKAMETDDKVDFASRMVAKIFGSQERDLSIVKEEEVEEAKKKTEEEEDNDK